jgi:DNA-binding NarL/FixJ family response regulator
MPQSRKRREKSLKPCRVLLVEDDDAFARALHVMLQADDRIEVVGRARDGHEGLDLADELRPDLVVMDVALPGMDGVEATRVLRERHPGLPVIALTGLEYEERALEVREAGAEEFLRKGRLEEDLSEIVLAVAAGERRPAG